MPLSGGPLLTQRLSLDPRDFYNLTNFEMFGNIPFLDIVLGLNDVVTYLQIKNQWAKFPKGPPAWNGVDFGVKPGSTNYNIVDRVMMMIASRPIGDCLFGS